MYIMIHSLAQIKKGGVEQLELIYIIDGSIDMFSENSLAESVIGNHK